MKALFDRLNARRTSAGTFGRRLIESAIDNRLAVRLTAVLLMTALLLPLIYTGSFRTVSAAPELPNALPAAPPPAAPPAAFITSETNSLPAALVSKIVKGTQAVTDAYQFAANYFVSPPLPEGFEMAKVPTVRENIAASLSSAFSSLSSSITAPLLAAPRKSSRNAKANPDGADAGTAGTAKDGVAAESNETESAAEPAPPAAPVMTAPATVKFNFTGLYAPAEVSRWQTSGEWKIKNSSTGTFITDNSLGAGTAAAPADYDGDGITDRAVFTDYAGSWKILKSSTNQIQTVAPFGQSGDKVVSGDYDGDGTADLAVWRPSTGIWYVRQSGNLQVTSVQWGQAGDIPVPGNYDGDNRLDYAVYRSGAWYVLLSNSGYSFASMSWGAGTDIPVPADYDGDGRTDYAVYRPGNGTWYAYSSQANNGSYLGKIWGNYGDQPVPADYDNDGRADFAVWRPTTGVWYIANSSANYNVYDYHQLGIPGDVAVPSAYLKQIGGQVLTYDLANARLAPKNATGGTDPYSRNFGWSARLVGLPGRAGLDAGFGISYNSLVWTKEPNSNVMVFDADHANVSPGFNFGFPSIEPGYYNGLTQKFSYLMVTPSGGRVEFRQEAASNIYNAADSSYAQLKVSTPAGGGPQTPTEDVILTVTTTDGTQMDYDWKAGAYRLKQIKDRNGNFITVNYDGDYGLLRKVTDTLGREINISYDGEFYPTAITQQWKSGNGSGNDVIHTYATFTYTYTAITPGFGSGIGVYGPSGGANIKVLNNITYADNSSTSFAYNNYGQVYKVTWIQVVSATFLNCSCSLKYTSFGV